MKRNGKLRWRWSFRNCAPPNTLPPPWRARAVGKGEDTAGKARVVCDYIAGMTDRFAYAEHARLLG